MKVLITGISGQDGIFLTNKLLESHNDIEIYGTSRDYNEKKFLANLESVSKNKDFSKVNVQNIDLLNSNSVENMVSEIKPDYLFNLSGPSSVYESLINPNIKKEIVQIFDNLINAGLRNNHFFKFFQASSSEMFNQHDSKRLNENSSFNPISPYAEGKLIVHEKIQTIKKEYSWLISSGIMFNHESEFRENNYLTSKIINTAFQIYKKREDKLIIGSLDYVRDWSFAGDIMEAASILTFNDAKGSYVLGSGVGKSIKDLVQIVFSYFNLDWDKYVVVDNSLLRSGDPKIKISDPSKILNEYGWKTKLSFEDLIERCIENKLSASF